MQPGTMRRRKSSAERVPQECVRERETDWRPFVFDDQPRSGGLVERREDDGLGHAVERLKDRDVELGADESRERQDGSRLSAQAIQPRVEHITHGYWQFPPLAIDRTLWRAALDQMPGELNDEQRIA